ncbi:Hypothetical protein SMAX5B_009587 [Scophthalmus maximus]|uniref:Uncharacterized protein n=1 Tax=Scophthalmus maximus TaxID=52904 RepID=A0A2U9CKM0_SCOMX|nr:Hypothetical protein SMAX5B_009587 [Scophthalmus maximus]
MRCPPLIALQGIKNPQSFNRVDRRSIRTRRTVHRGQLLGSTAASTSPHLRTDHTLVLATPARSAGHLNNT